MVHLDFRFLDEKENCVMDHAFACQVFVNEEICSLGIIQRNVRCNLGQQPGDPDELLDCVWAGSCA